MVNHQSTMSIGSINVEDPLMALIYFLSIFIGLEGGRMPRLKDIFTNMSVPMPLHRKLYLVFRNNAIKIIKRQTCCGHPGEPGC
jgi:hypothetical protein